MRYSRLNLAMHFARMSDVLYLRYIRQLRPTLRVQAKDRFFESPRLCATLLRAVRADFVATRCCLLTFSGHGPTKVSEQRLQRWLERWPTASRLVQT